MEYFNRDGNLKSKITINDISYIYSTTDPCPFSNKDRLIEEVNMNWRYYRPDSDIVAFYWLMKIDSTAKNYFLKKDEDSIAVLIDEILIRNRD